MKLRIVYILSLSLLLMSSCHPNNQSTSFDSSELAFSSINEYSSSNNEEYESNESSYYSSEINSEQNSTEEIVGGDDLQSNWDW